MCQHKVDGTLAYLRAFPFLPRDAFPLAIMRHEGIEHLVTLDTDFLTMPDLHIYPCRPTILRQGVRL